MEPQIPVALGMFETIFQVEVELQAKILEPYAIPLAATRSVQEKSYRLTVGIGVVEFPEQADHVVNIDHGNNLLVDGEPSS